MYVRSFWLLSVSLVEKHFNFFYFGEKIERRFIIKREKEKKRKREKEKKRKRERHDLHLNNLNSY